MSEKMPAAFANWYERWWQNEPNAIAKANAHAAFFAGWDACVAAQGAAPVPSSGVDEDALVQRIYDELMTDDAVAEVWSNGKVLATARRLVKFAVQGGESRGE